MSEVAAAFAIHVDRSPMRAPADLPQLNGTRLMTDGGIETDLIFHRGVSLPAFAAFPLLDSPSGRAHLEAYYRDYVDLARRTGTGLLLESPTWRASARWGAELGYDAAALERVNREAIAMLRQLRDEADGLEAPVLVSGVIGPSQDGYTPEHPIDAAWAQAYHGPQVRAFAAAGVDLVTALTLGDVGEAVGLVRAARAAGVPAVIAFTVETDGRLPSGLGLADAIEAVDAQTDGGAAYFMVNCAHPTHLEPALASAGPWARLGGLRPNASTLSHAELDEAEELDEGDPDGLATAVAALVARFPRLTVLGGCCGTDVRHVAAIVAAVPAS